MDDELKAIQADVDSVLNRLAEYMKHDTQAREADDPHPMGRKDAARVLLHYASGRGSLESSIRVAPDVPRDRWPGPKIKAESRLGELADKNSPDRLANLVWAMRALWEWQWHRFPLEDKHIFTLAREIDAWSYKQCEFIGESAGLPLTPKRQVDRRKVVREIAAHEVFQLNQRDPVKFPVTEALFEKVGEWYGMSASTVARAYYSCDDVQEARKWVKQNQSGEFSKNDET